MITFYWKLRINTGQVSEVRCDCPGAILCVCIVVCNLAVIRALCRLGCRGRRRRLGRRISRHSSRHGSHSTSDITYDAATTEEVSFARLMAVLSISFVVCWVPQLVRSTTNCSSVICSCCFIILEYSIIYSQCAGTGIGGNVDVTRFPWGGAARFVERIWVPIPFQSSWFWIPLVSPIYFSRKFWGEGHGRFLPFSRAPLLCHVICKSTYIAQN